MFLNQGFNNCTFEEISEARGLIIVSEGSMMAESNLINKHKDVGTESSILEDDFSDFINEVSLFLEI